jgi:hypothetical protein
MVIVLKSTFNNISFISWRLVLIEETGVSGKKPSILLLVDY